MRASRASRPAIDDVEQTLVVLGRELVAVTGSE